jgi:hypothetical protein
MGECRGEGGDGGIEKGVSNGGGREERVRLGW